MARVIYSSRFMLVIYACFLSFKQVFPDDLQIDLSVGLS